MLKEIYDVFSEDEYEGRLIVDGFYGVVKFWVTLSVPRVTSICWSRWAKFASKTRASFKCAMMTAPWCLTTVKHTNLTTVSIGSSHVA